MPYAIIRAGGHQEKVTPGEQITMDHLKQEVGETVEFKPLLFAPDAGGIVSDKAALEQGGATVVGTVVKHLKGDKIDIFQYRHKTGYRRHTGHRQPLTLIEISEIRFGGESFTPPAKVEEPVVEAEADAPKKVEAKEKTPAKKSAAKAKK